jgi:hypothetical protein
VEGERGREEAAVIESGDAAMGSGDDEEKERASPEPKGLPGVREGESVDGAKENAGTAIDDGGELAAARNVVKRLGQAQARGYDERLVKNGSQGRRQHRVSYHVQVLSSDGHR